MLFFYCYVPCISDAQRENGVKDVRKVVNVVMARAVTTSLDIVNVNLDLWEKRYVSFHRVSKFLHHLLCLCIIIIIVIAKYSIAYHDFLH